MNFHSFIDPNYYFSSRPSIGNFEFLLPLLIFFVLLFGLATYYRIAFGVYKKNLVHYQKLADRVSNWLFTIAIFGLLYVFFRYEGIMYLSSRILLFVVLIAWVIWGYFIFRFYQQDFLRLKTAYSSREEKKVYLPKSRRKKK
jgi:hypothetical protein